MARNKWRYSKMNVAIVSFILFPTDISDKTSVAIEEGSGLLFTTITQGKTTVKLDVEETFKLKEILAGLKKVEK